MGCLHFTRAHPDVRWQNYNLDSASLLGPTMSHRKTLLDRSQVTRILVSLSEAYLRSRGIEKKLRKDFKNLKNYCEQNRSD